MQHRCVKSRGVAVGFRCEVALKPVQHQRVVAGDLAVDGGGNAVQPSLAKPTAQYLHHTSDRHRRDYALPNVFEQLVIADVLVRTTSESLQQFERQRVTEKA